MDWDRADIPVFPADSDQIAITDAHGYCLLIQGDLACSDASDFF